MSDNLPRRQEEPHRKRVRHSPPLSIQSGSDELDSSARETDRSARGGDVDESEEEEGDKDKEDSSKEDNEELMGESLDDGTFDDGEDSTSDSQCNPVDLLNEPDRFKISRVKAKQIREKKLPGSFSALGISPQLQSALTTMSIRTPTEVQAACIPPLLAGK